MAIYNNSDPLEKKRFLARAQYLADKGKLARLEDEDKRTLKQNDYMHTIIRILALDTGNDFEYVKEQWFKKYVNREIFVVVTQDPYLGRNETLRSSASCTKEELTIAIDRFRMFAAENGYYLPSPEEWEQLKAAKAEISKNRQYL